MEKSLATLLKHSFYTPKRERLAHIEETVDSVVHGREQFVTGETLLKTSDGDPLVKRRKMKFGYNLPEFAIRNFEGTAPSQGESDVDLRSQLTLIARELITAVQRSQYKRENDNQQREVVALNEPVLAELYASPLNKENVAFQMAACHRPDDREDGSGIGTATNPICLEGTIEDEFQVSSFGGANLPVNTTTQLEPNQEEVELISTQNQLGNVSGPERCIDRLVSHSVSKRSVLMKKQVPLQTKTGKSSVTDNGQKGLAGSVSGRFSKPTRGFGIEPDVLEELSMIGSSTYIGKDTQIASREGPGSQLFAQIGGKSAKCRKPGVVLAQKQSPTEEPSMSCANQVMEKVVPKFGRR